MKKFGKFSSKRDDFNFSTTELGFGTVVVKVMRDGPRGRVEDMQAIYRPDEGLQFRSKGAEKEAKYDLADLKKAMGL